MDELLKSISPILESYINKRNEKLNEKLNRLQTELEKAESTIDILTKENNNLKDRVFAFKNNNDITDQDVSKNTCSTNVSDLDDRLSVNNLISSPREDINSIDNGYENDSNYYEINNLPSNGKANLQNYNDLNKFSQKEEKISSSLDLSKDNTFHYRFDSSPIDFDKENYDITNVKSPKTFHHDSTSPRLKSRKKLGLLTPITVKKQPIGTSNKQLTLINNPNSNMNQDEFFSNQKKRRLADSLNSIESSAFNNILINDYKFKRLNVDQIMHNVKHSILIDFTFNPLTGKKWVVEDFVENTNNELLQIHKASSLESLLKTFKDITNKRLQESISTSNQEATNHYDENINSSPKACENCKRLLELTGYGVKIMSPSWDDTQPQNKKYVKAIPVCTHRKQQEKYRRIKSLKNENHSAKKTAKSDGFFRKDLLDNNEDSDLETPPGYFNSSFPSTQQLLDEKKKAKMQTGKITLKKFLSATDISFPKLHIYIFRNKLFNRIVNDGYFSYNHIIIAEYLHILKD